MLAKYYWTLTREAFDINTTANQLSSVSEWPKLNYKHKLMHELTKFMCVFVKSCIKCFLEAGRKGESEANVTVEQEKFRQMIL